MTYRIIIPVRPPEEGKSRLAPSLEPRARALLVERMFRHVLMVASQSVQPQQIWVVSRSPYLLNIAASGGMVTIGETGHGLNSALEQATSAGDPAQPVLALSADLPLLNESDLAAMAVALESSDVVAASDRAGTGTNAILLRHPGAIPYAFGEGSLARHRALAATAGHRFTPLDRQGLAVDIDLPCDLPLVQIGPHSRTGPHPRCCVAWPG